MLLESQLRWRNLVTGALTVGIKHLSECHCKVRRNQRLINMFWSQIVRNTYSYRSERSLISRQTLSDHGPHWQCVQSLAYRVDAAQFRYVAKVDTFSLYSSRLRWAFKDGSVSFVTQHASSNRIRFEWWQAHSGRCRYT